MIASVFAQSENIKIGLIENEKIDLLLTDAQLSEAIGKKLNNLVFSNAVLVKMNDQESGLPFYALKANGKRGDMKVSIIVVLTQKDAYLLAGIDGCVMECASSLENQNCEQSIIVPCQSQKCGCEKGGSSKIKFFNTPKTTQN